MKMPQNIDLSSQKRKKKEKKKKAKKQNHLIAMIPSGHQKLMLFKHLPFIFF
jgi:hypothetical protein